VGDRGSAEERGLGEADFRVEAEDFPRLDEAGGVDYAFRSEEVEAAELVVVAEDSPGGLGRGILLTGRAV
jgi:hypothetical protein